MVVHVVLLECQRRGIVEVRDGLYLGLAELVLEGRVMMVMVVMMIVIVLS